MSYNKIPYIIALSLGTSLLASAQQADTLRRQLRVLTHQDEEIAERQPLALNYELPKAKVVNPLTPSPSSLRPYMPALSLEPLSMLSPLKDFYNRDKQRGYATVGAGLQYNAYLATAWRAIDAPKQILDIQLAGHYTDHRLVNYDRERSLREQALMLGGDYKHSYDTGFELQVGAKFRHDKHNYYGYIEPTASQANVATPYLQTNQLRLYASIGQSKPQLYSLAYRFKPYMQYTQASGIAAYDGEDKGRELQLGIEGELRYAFEQEHYLGLDVVARSYSYNQAQSQNSKQGYQNGSSLSLKPYWHYASSDSFDWGVSAGASLNFYTQGEERGISITPYAEAYAKFSKALALRLDLGGGVQLNSLSRMLGEMPYLAMGVQTKPTLTPIDAKLSLDALLSPDLELKTFLAYTKHRAAVNYLYTEQGLFVPEYADGSVWRLGGQVIYRFAPTFNLRGQASYNHWSKNAEGLTKLYARPRVELLAELTYRPWQNVECILGAEIKQGMDQALVTPNGIKREPIPAISLFRLSANYQVHPKWTLGATAHLLSDRLATPHYGYLSQRFTTTLFLTYKF